MLVPAIGIGLIAGAVFVLAWRLLLQYNRRKSRRILGWIERVFQGHGEVAGMHWETSSRFHVSMKRMPSIFRDPSLKVQLHPRELPVVWLLREIRKQQETLTFQADLDCAPCFDLEVNAHRWFGRTQRQFPKDRNWKIERAGPFVLTTRDDWQREITAMMGALVASRECDCLSVSIRRCSPHFAVTVPLAAIDPESRMEVFDVLRELAAGVTSARF